MKRSLVVATLAAMVCGGAATSFADPITLVSANAARIYMVGGSAHFGNINVWQDSGSAITFNLSGGMTSTFPLDVFCQPCFSGQTFNPGWGMVGELATVSGWRGDSQHPDERWSNLSLIGNFWLTAGSLVLPVDAPSIYNVVLPLTFDASLYGATFASWAGVIMHVQAFSFPGQVAVQFVTGPDGNGGRVFRIGSLDYAAQAAPTPEPASMLLVGTVLAGLGASRLRRNRRQSAMGHPPITNESHD